MEKCESQQTSAFPFNPVEGGISSSSSGTQEECTQQNKEQPGTVQSMYCKELVLAGSMEFSFEELRAQRYYKQLNEKVVQLNKVKEELKFQIEQKQKIIQGRGSSSQHVIADDNCTPDGPNESAPLKIHNEPAISRNSALRNSINSEDMKPGTTDVNQRSSQAPKSFAVYDENVLPEKSYEKQSTRSSSATLKSLKLPTSILKSRQPASDVPSDKDSSLSRPEEAIVNAHWNKTLCRSPDDTCDFVRAAQLASTPFGGPGKQNPSERGQIEEVEALDKTGSAVFKEANTEARAQAKKLSPIQEISHEWGCTSLASTYPLELESQGRTRHHSGIKEIIQTTSGVTVSALALEAEPVNPCSVDVRKALLDNVDLSSFANFSKKVGPLPDSGDLHLDDETLSFIKKMDNLGMRLYCSAGGCVHAKVEESTVPWDFYINSQLRSRLPADLQHCHAQSTCYLFENGSFTLWQVPDGQTIQELIENDMDRNEVPPLAVRLLEMVKQMHSCQLVHGALHPETLLVCHSCEGSVVCMDFSNSLDMKLQTGVKSVQSLPSAQEYIKQGLLLPHASPYQVDLCGLAELVHFLLFGKKMEIIKDASYWRLAEDCAPLDWQKIEHSNLYGPLWQDFFHNLLNPEDNSTEFVLSKTITNLNHALYGCLECPFSL